MKYIFLPLFLLSASLFAKADNECYSVQVKSFYLKTNSSYNFRSQNYPDSCKLITISGMSTVRCGCFESYSDAKQELHDLSEVYYDAMIVNTYKYRFNNQTTHKEYNFKNVDIPQKESYSEDSFSIDDDIVDELELDNSTYLDEYGYK